MKKKVGFSVVLGVLISTLSGCGGDEAAKPNASQVAAKVNGAEVTVHQVNQVLKTIPEGGGQSVEELANQVLDRLINQEVLLQQAMKMKLDRDPAVLTAIEAAKRKVLVDAYVARVLQGGTPSVNQEQIRDYYDTHPKYFTDRKVFTYTQLLVKVTGDEADDLIEKVKVTSDVDVFIPELKSMNLPYKISHETEGSEKLAKPLLEPIYSLKVGDVGYLKLNDGLLIVQLRSVIDEPVMFDRAKVAIESYLNAEAKKNETGKLVSDLRGQAQVEYVGNFSAVNTGVSDK